ncbi:MAG TPA: hypothetical protein VFA35_10800, partial [Burkholderiaceae bacterium]|nr:hypothetical protein [Burkholderiaceae bacterium]
ECWSVYAWPVEYGVTGLRAFAITQHGDVLWTRNEVHFSGRQKPMPPTAALRAEANGTLRGPYTVNDIAADGSTWGIIQ